MATYHRVILKLSGEALGVDGHGFCHEKFEEAAALRDELRALEKEGAKHDEP